MRRLMVIATSQGVEQAIQAYEKRFGIEPMFNDQTSNGFDIEGTKATDPKRIETLLLLMALAHIFCTREGARKERDREAKKTPRRDLHPSRWSLSRWAQSL